jgi:hypothetical protein
MIAMMDTVGVELEARRRRATLHGAMVGSRRGSLRRPLGTWLMGIGLRLAPDAIRTAPNRP